jgi:hypothetical protein
MRGARAWIESHQTLTIIIGVAIFATVATMAMSGGPLLTIFLATLPKGAATVWRRSNLLWRLELLGLRLTL